MSIEVGQLPDEARERIRKQSKTLFGNRNTLEVAVAVAQNPDAAVNATDLGFDLRLAANRVRAQLLAFVDLGYMAESGTAELKRWFIRKDVRFWSMCMDLYEDWTG